MDGPNVRDFGLMFTTRMVIVKLSDGSLWLSSPVWVPFDTLQQITKLGVIRYLVAATPRHVWRLDAWHSLFPKAQLWAARSTLFTLQKGHLPLSGTLADTSFQGWAEDLDQLAFKGNPLIEELMDHISENPGFHAENSITCLQLKPARKRFVLVLKKRELAHIGSNGTAHLRLTCAG